MKSSPIRKKIKELIEFRTRSKFDPKSDGLEEVSARKY